MAASPTGISGYASAHDVGSRTSVIPWLEYERIYDEAYYRGEESIL